MVFRGVSVERSNAKFRTVHSRLSLNSKRLGFSSSVDIYFAGAEQHSRLRYMIPTHQLVEFFGRIETSTSFQESLRYCTCFTATRSASFLLETQNQTLVALHPTPAVQTIPINTPSQPTDTRNNSPLFHSTSLAGEARRWYRRRGVLWFTGKHLHTSAATTSEHLRSGRREFTGMRRTISGSVSRLRFIEGLR